MTPNSIPVDRVRIFDRAGSMLAEFKARVERSWALSSEGRAQFTYATRITDIVNPKVLNFGNWLLIENDTLPTWVGVIDTPRSWSARNVTVSAYTTEHVFSWRRGEIETSRYTAAGNIFEYLLYLVNVKEPTIISKGIIDNSGVIMSETINPTSVSDVLKRIQSRSQEEYSFRPVVNDAGRLTVFADWSKRVGVDTSALLHEGKGGGNIEQVGGILVEDGPIVNDYIAYNDAMTWGSKLIKQEFNRQSISDYGLRQGGGEYSGVTRGTTMRQHAAGFIRRNGTPRGIFRINALNVGETFKYLAIGNRLFLQFQSSGFSGGGLGYEARVRVIGMHYDSANKNKINMTVEVSP